VIDERLDADVDLLAVVVRADDTPRRAAQMGTFVGYIGQADRRVLAPPRHPSGTERGVANDLVEAGVPKERIVLGFQPPYTGFAA
jgi:hypothetical protein